MPGHRARRGDGPALGADLVNWAGTTWSYHPVQAAPPRSGSRSGIGVWLIAAPHARWSRLAGLASVGWGLVVWIFGESFGGIFAPGQTWLTGAPGAALVYCVAGALIALPTAPGGTTARRPTLAGPRVFLLGMAVLQAWPGRGFWQGVSHGRRVRWRHGPRRWRDPQPPVPVDLVGRSPRSTRARLRGQPGHRDRASAERRRVRERRPSG